MGIVPVNFVKKVNKQENLSPYAITFITPSSVSEYVDENVGICCLSLIIWETKRTFVVNTISFAL